MIKIVKLPHASANKIGLSVIINSNNIELYYTFVKNPKAKKKLCTFEKTKDNRNGEDIYILETKDEIQRSIDLTKAKK